MIVSSGTCRDLLGDLLRVPLPRLALAILETDRDAVHNQLAVDRTAPTRGRAGYKNYQQLEPNWLLLLTKFDDKHCTSASP